MIIKSSTSLRNEYNEIADICKKQNQPVFLTKNGEGDLVIMSMEHYSYREELLNMREKLLEAEEHRIHETKTYSLDDVNARLEEIINGAE